MSALDNYNGQNYFYHPFGLKAPDTVINTYDGHGPTELDLSLPGGGPATIGTPVYSMCDGVVVYAHYNYGSTQYVGSGGGNEILIRAKNTAAQANNILTGDLTIYYCHLVNPREYPEIPTLVEGQEIKKGQLIGGMGASGHTEGNWYVDGYGIFCHLHLNINARMRVGSAAYNEYHNKVIHFQSYPDCYVEDKLSYAIFCQDPVYIKVEADSGAAPAGGLLYNPTSYTNERGGTMAPAKTDAYGNLTMSQRFMGAYPSTQQELDSNLGLKMAYLICAHEYNEGEEGRSYAKLLRARIIYHAPNGASTSYRQPNATLETFCRWWQAQGWGAYNVITEAASRTTWDLEFAQYVYNNIRYGPAYGLTSDWTIKGFQACAFENGHDGAGHPSVNIDSVQNLAPNEEFVPGYYYVMYSTFNFMNITAGDTNPAIIPDKEEHTHEERDGAHYFDGLIVVNKTYSMSQAAISAVGGLKPEAVSAYNAMKSAWDAYAVANNIYNEPMSMASGYRTYADQQAIYNSYPPADRDTYSARPGYSEHHTGLAIDVTSANSDPTSGYKARYPRQSAWLAAHCYEYGFIIRYKENKQNITGYIYEPWHIRYVGTEWAQKLKDTTMEEYFGIDSQYK